MKRVGFNRGDHVEMGAQMLRRLADEKTYLVADEGALYRYTGKIWRPVDPSKQSRIVQTFAGSPTRAGRPLKVNAQDIAGALRCAQDQVRRTGFFGAGPRGLSFKNGFLSVGPEGQISLRRHHPDHRARFVYDFPYREGEPKQWLAMLNEVFKNDSDAAAKIAVIQQFGGACLVGTATRFQKALVLIGDGGNGKSTVSNILEGIFPKEMKSSVAPQQWDNEYRRAMLAGKRLNIVQELPDGKILAGDVFKQFITGDRLDARHIRESPFEFRPVAGHLFSANQLPGTHDQSQGFWRRFIVLRFSRNVERLPNRNVNIVDDILREETAAIAYWLLQGASALHEQGEYVLPVSHNEELNRWQIEADTVANWLSGHAKKLTLNSEFRTGGLRASVTFQRYCEWAERSKHRHMSSTTFGRRLRQLGVVSRRTTEGVWYALELIAGAAG